MLAVREYFPAREASWRVPVVLLLSGCGMATGTWLAGALYDHFGYYAPAFAAGVAFNIANFIVHRDAGVRRRVYDRERYSGLMPAFLMIGHHLSTSALCQAASACGVC